MNIEIILLWSFALFLAFPFCGIMSHSVLESKYGRAKTILWWGLFSAFEFVLLIINYRLNISNDVIGLLIQTFLLCGAAYLLYKDPVENKLFIALTASLVATVFTFLFCGTTDTFLGAALGLFDPVFGPYTVSNILLFTGLKIIVFAVLIIIFTVFFKKKLKALLAVSKGQIRNYLVAPVVATIGFQIIVYVSNTSGIVPNNSLFLPLYLTVCIIFAVQYALIFTSIKWTVTAVDATKLANTDELTGLGSKKSYTDAVLQLEEDIKAGTASFAMAMIDLNYLKKTNDSYGHDKGDKMIKLLASHIRKAFPYCDSYRVGGDEFVVIANGKESSNMDGMISTLRGLNESGGGEKPWEQVSAAVGYSAFNPDTDTNVKEVYIRADRQMYENKSEMRAGR